MKTLAERVMELKGKTFYTELSRRCGIPAAAISRIARGVDTDPSYSILIALANDAFFIPTVVMLEGVYDKIDWVNPYLVSQSTSLIGNGKRQRLTVEVYPVGG